MAPPRVLIPVSPLDQAKTRLDGFLTPEERAGLQLALLATVVEVAQGAGCPVTVLTSGPEVVAALPPGVDWMREVEGVRGLNAQLQAAVGRLDGEAVLILHADLPYASAADVRRVLEAAGETAPVTMVASADGGTKALLLRPPEAIPLHYGPGSHAAHLAAAATMGVATVNVAAPGLERELDTPDDVRALLADPAGRATRAGAYLLGLDLSDRRA